MFNDAAVKQQIDALPNLHDKFRVRIDCPKTGYELTRDKCDAMIAHHKTKLRGLIRRYNVSGNGSDMAKFDEDTDNEEEEIIEDEDTYGRFNEARAIRRSSCRTKERPDLQTTNGDDRASFLLHQPPDLLYWWHVMDKLNLLFFTMCKMNDNNSASVGGSPSS